ncbi:MAG: hypothetical protein RL156_1687 [Bacteroidota bacterium]|jgi:hypothetical protein
MNLVQIQERLKDTPTPALMQYANGMNPMVPPYLALAELQRRESITKAAANQQGMAQGQQPSVKEQVEQAAGLAALQKQAQAKGLQALTGAAQPAPPVPTPQRQPEAEGISELPTEGMYNFAEGGIIGYAAGGLPDYESRVLTTEELQEQYKRALRAGKPVVANAILEVIKKRQPSEPKTVSVPVAEMEAPQQAPEFGFQGNVADITRQIASIQDPTDRQRAQEQFQQEISAGNPKLQTAQPQRPPVMQPEQPARPMPAVGIAALPGAEESAQFMRQRMAEPSPQQAIGTEREIAKVYGIDQPYGDERMKRVQEMQAERQKMLEPRGMERLMRVLGGIAGRGLEGAGPAYLQAIEAERASDLEFRKQMDALMAGTEEKRRAAMEARAERARGEFGKARELQAGAASEMFRAAQQRELRQAELELRKLELKAQQKRELTPDEQWLVSYAQGDPNRYLEGTEKLYGAKTGAKADLTREGRLQAAQTEYRKAMLDPMQKAAMEQANIKTFEDFAKRFYPQLAQGASEVDPIVAKGLQIIGSK